MRAFFDIANKHPNTINAALLCYKVSSSAIYAGRSMKQFLDKHLINLIYCSVANIAQTILKITDPACGPAGSLQR